MLALRTAHEGSPALILVLLAAGGAGCGGDPFTVGSDAGTSDSGSGPGPVEGGLDVASPLEAGLESGGGTSDAEPSNWCGTQGMHLFCEDFTDGVPGKFTTEATGGGTVTADTVVYRSPPQSMLGTTPSLPAAGDSADALVVASFSNDGFHDTLQADLLVSSACFNGADPDDVTALALTFPAEHYLLAVAISRTGGAQLVELVSGADGGVSNAATHAFTSAVPLDRWTTLVLDAHLSTALVAGGAKATVRLNDVTVLDTGLTLVPAAAQHPTIGLGASMKNSLGLSHGCNLHVDNVLFDIGL